MMPTMEDLDTPSPCEGWHDESEVVFGRESGKGDVTLPKGIPKRGLVINHARVRESFLIKFLPEGKKRSGTVIEIVGDHPAVAFGKGRRDR